MKAGVRSLGIRITDSVALFWILVTKLWYSARLTHALKSQINSPATTLRPQLQLKGFRFSGIV